MEEMGEAYHTLFENRKKCMDFGEKNSDYVFLWIKFSIQNKVLIVSRAKNRMFPCGVFFCSVFDEMFIEVHLKNFWLHSCTQVLFFLQNAPS